MSSIARKLVQGFKQVYQQGQVQLGNASPFLGLWPPIPGVRNNIEALGALGVQRGAQRLGASSERFWALPKSRLGAGSP